MKKIILIFLILAGIIGAWWFTSSRSLSTKESGVNQEVSNEKPSPEQILENDYQKIARNLKAENISGDEWKKINTYSIKPEELVTKESAAEYLKAAQANIPDIYTCLKKDFCGMTTRGEDDAYFDDQRTPAHILINRNLKVMKESLRKDESLKSQVDWELMQELASSGSEMLAVEALDIIREFDTNGMKTDELIKMTEDYKGTAKADALVRISKKGSASDKLLLARDIEEVFAMSDANTVISVLENLKQMSLSATELSRVLRNLCRFKDNAAEEQNWKMIKYEANKLNSEFEKSCN